MSIGVVKPMAPRALLDKWTGPYPILEKKGKVTYLVDLGTPRNPHRFIHVNRMKPHHDGADMTMLMVTDGGEERVRHSQISCALMQRMAQ